MLKDHFFFESGSIFRLGRWDILGQLRPRRFCFGLARPFSIFVGKGSRESHCARATLWLGSKSTNLPKRNSYAVEKMYYIVYILKFKLEYYKEVMESISCNGGDVFDFAILYETNISLNAKKSVNVKSISKTSPSSSNFRSSSSEKKKV